jgi:uncharacterized protein (TIGR02145 family)
MKKLFTLLAFVVTMTAMAQSVAISDDGSVADGSAILEVKSTTKGFLLPRMNKEQRDVIGAVAGLQIWCTDCLPIPAMYFYNGSEWSTGGTGITPEQATAITDNTKKAGITTEQTAIIDNTSGSNTGDKTLAELEGVASNELISGATSTKITYDAKGLVTSGVAATTDDIAVSSDKNYVTDAQVVVLENTSNTNRGDNATNTQYSDQAGLIASLQAHIADLISDNTLVSRSVAIGTQQWMKKNLDVATYRDGTAIPEVRNQGEWEALTTAAWCYYGNDANNGTTYGKLYNWYAVMGITTEEDATPTPAQIAARKQLAPTGWHVPSSDEWTTLTTFLGGESVAGGKMKEVGEAHWKTPNTDATNSSGFTALPGGYRMAFDLNGTMFMRGLGLYWSSTQDGAARAWYHYMFNDSGELLRNSGGKGDGLSVRLLKD